jgi:hypothetical protein
MPLTSEVLGEIENLVRGGFETRDRIIEIICEELYKPGELDEAEVTVAVDAAFTASEKAKTTWPAVTDCDKLDKVFDALNARGVIALQNAGYTQSDGCDDILEAHHKHPTPDKIIGHCFYHGQDLERAVNGQGLHLAFGPIDSSKEGTEGPRIGAMIVEELAQVGFSTQWNGTFAKRIYVPEIDWKRR